MTRYRGLAYFYEIDGEEIDGVLIRHHLYKHTQFGSMHVRTMVTFKDKYLHSNY